MGLSLDVKAIGLLFKKFERIHTQDARKMIQKKKSRRNEAKKGNKKQNITEQKEQGK